MKSESRPTPILRVQIENVFQNLAMQTELYADEIKQVVQDKVKSQIYKLDIDEIITKEANRIAIATIGELMRAEIREQVEEKVEAYKRSLRTLKPMPELGIKDIFQSCEACPSQWEIELESGHMIYVRYRWGYLSIRKSAEPTSNIRKAINGEEVFGVQLREGLDGSLSEEEMLKHLKKIL